MRGNWRQNLRGARGSIRKASRCAFSTGTLYCAPVPTIVITASVDPRWGPLTVRVWLPAGDLSSRIFSSRGPIALCSSELGLNAAGDGRCGDRDTAVEPTTPA